MRGAGEEIRLRGLCGYQRGRRRVDAGRRAHPGRLGLCAHGGPRGPHRAGGAPGLVPVYAWKSPVGHCVPAGCARLRRLPGLRRRAAPTPAWLDRPTRPCWTASPARRADGRLASSRNTRPPAGGDLESCGARPPRPRDADLDFALAALRKATGADDVGSRRTRSRRRVGRGVRGRHHGDMRALGVAGAFGSRGPRRDCDQRAGLDGDGAALSVGNHVATSLGVGGAAGVVFSRSSSTRRRAALPRTSRTSRALPRRRRAEGAPRPNASHVGCGGGAAVGRLRPARRAEEPGGERRPGGPRPRRGVVVRSNVSFRITRLDHF